MSGKKLNLVVAMCNNRGIGVDGHLPWRLKGDMAFFKKITSETKDTDLKNAVIMGRKTWDSIPAKFRPLPNRINIVISHTLREAPDGMHLASGMSQALDLLTEGGPLCKEVENVFVIGGSSIYKMALEHPDCQRIYLTRVLADFTCDTFLPAFEEEKFKQVEDPSIDSSTQTENGLDFRIEVYEKLPAYAENWMPIYCVAAMMRNRGIGKDDGQLPWPFLKTDYEFYNGLASKPSTPGKKTIQIMGRKTWNSCWDETRSNPNTLIIVMSNLKHLLDAPEKAHYVVGSFEEALKLINTSPVKEQADRVVVMGGYGVYQAAMNHPLCTTVFLTRLEIDLEADAFFPVMENAYTQISNKDSKEYVPEGEIEENGVKYRFEVWKHKSFCG